MDEDIGENVTDEKTLIEIGLMALEDAGHSKTGMKGALEVLKACGYNGETRRRALIAGQVAARRELAGAM